MKNFVIIIALLIAGTSSASAWDLKDALKKRSDSTTVADKSGTASAIGNLIGGLISTSKLSVKDIAGSWRYAAPAVAFKSSKLLSAAGNAAANSAADKIEPYFRAAGIDKMKITVNADSSFTLTLRGVTLKGDIRPTGDAATKSTDKSEATPNFNLSFRLFGAPLLQTETYITKNDKGNISMMFDMQKLLKLLETVGRLSGNQTAAKAADMLKGHEDMTAGFELTADTTAAEDNSGSKAASSKGSTSLQDVLEKLSKKKK